MEAAHSAQENTADLAILESPAKRRKLEPFTFDLAANFPTLEDVSCRICMTEPCPTPIWRCSSSPMHFLCNACAWSLNKEKCPYCRVPFGYEDRVRYTELEQYINDKFLNQFICKFPGCTARFSTEDSLKHHQELECGFICPLSSIGKNSCCGKTGTDIRHHFACHDTTLQTPVLKLEINLRKWRGGRAYPVLLSNSTDLGDTRAVLAVATRGRDDITVESWASPISPLYSYRVAVKVIFTSGDQRMSIPVGYCIIRPFTSANKHAPPMDHRRVLSINYENLTSILLALDSSKLSMHLGLELDKPDVISLDD